MATIKLKRSGETGSAPGTDDLVHGELAINYAKKNKIDFEIIEPQKRKLSKKSYADNFTK